MRKLRAFLSICLAVLSILLTSNSFAKKISYSTIASFEGQTPFAIRNSIISADKAKIAVAIKNDIGGVRFC